MSCRQAARVPTHTAYLGRGEADKDLAVVLGRDHLVDDADRVDVARHMVPADLVAHAERPLDVDAAAHLERAQRRPLERLLDAGEADLRGAV